jgi:hypothetical protein
MRLASQRSVPYAGSLLVWYQLNRMKRPQILESEKKIKRLFTFDKQTQDMPMSKTLQDITFTTWEENF